MNRDDLDAFFARAEDVLTDWQPSGDAMVARVADEGVDPPRADSYYSPPAAAAPTSTRSGQGSAPTPSTSSPTPSSSRPSRKGCF